MRSRFTVTLAVILITLGLPGALAGAGPGIFEGPVPRAHCGPGSRPETGVQGSVPVPDRASGRSAQDYTCNTELDPGGDGRRAPGSFGGTTGGLATDSSGQPLRTVI